MNSRRSGGLWTIAALVAVWGAATAQQLPASVRPHEDNRPAAKLEAPPASPAAMELLDLMQCVNELARGRFAQGEAACSDAIALNAKNSTAYKMRGYGYLLEHRFERADADFRIALRLKPQDAESLAGYGESLSGQGKFHAAVAQFTSAIAQTPKASAYWNARCWARAGEGRNLTAALADCNQALALSPGAPGALNSRGLVRLRMRQFQAAEADYTTSLMAKPTQPSARFGRGLARLNLGQKESGVADIAAARHDDPEIDSLFVLMGALPRDCAAHPGLKNCPPVTPGAGEKKPRQPWLMVSEQFGGDDDILLGIEAGRIDIMLDQIALILHQAARSAEREMVADSQIALMPHLSRAVLRFNQLLPAACRSVRLSPLICAGPYRPTWLAVPRAADPALALEDVYGHVHPVWAALCAGNGKICRME